MFHGLTLPRYSEVKKWEGGGNYAVSRYYRFPFRFFYRKKLRMILSMLDKKTIYKNILDYGSGPARIFRPALLKRAVNVACVDSTSGINFRARYDVIVCASVLEFVQNLHIVVALLNTLMDDGVLIVASPMDNWLTRLYFWAIGDKNKRHSKEKIIREISTFFKITETKTWLGLYFVVKATQK